MLTHTLLVVSLWIHILAAATWIGGALFLAIVLVPALRDPAARDRGLDLFHRVARRFLWVGWACFALLLATGTMNLLLRGGLRLDDTATGPLWSSSYGRALAWKLTLVGLVLLLSAAHDFVLGPLARKAGREDAMSPRARRLRLTLRWAGRLNLLLGLLIVGLGVVLTRGWPW